ncbi:toll/interleukin-1 receptor domain-containing protein [Mesorhizobium sp.]|uniref:toll/interleukin-1 receptor domain-containing protein n=1 Tax=Mesorhizobium sp. TaxID=1871066 RepID=UPI000FE8304A|nr:toll/interleukin-1 receptor domain-containing protein [Mesorhizobium sp.]RWD72797.1 MAG: toll/interleukin-1 receptor domain-containing protein [Mesorhizobium sp.]TIV60029.1 MAG: toll/interleukin-1 receptor domain-containing protein [Mesorhizobium sp.]
MIFLSHNHADKPVIEPVALRLREIFGQNKVFYDSWSIQPGDGIIDKMNEGLTSPKFVFFFVSEKSLQSNMVKLEWQNALYKATKGECKIIPVRVDGSTMPPVLLQNVYIDMFANGIEAAIVQIVNVIQGNNTFTPQHMGFSNLTYSSSGDPSVAVDVVISASHLMEPNPSFLVFVDNEEGEAKIELNGGMPFRGGFNKGITLDNGVVLNAFVIAPLGGAITPKMPMKLKLTPQQGKPVAFRGIFHQASYEEWKSIPPKN